MQFMQVADAFHAHLPASQFVHDGAAVADHLPAAQSTQYGCQL
jgi:hypothetical protein